MVIGILAHVDAGKTTLSETMLYHSGAIRKIGRVDHGDAFLDTDDMEKKRGITIYSKEAVFTRGDRKIYMIDTPGHIDFSAEMERALNVLDYAVLVVSGTDGVQAHTETLWRLLELYGIPVFIFVNKMDMTDGDRHHIMKGLDRMTGGRCADFTDMRADSCREVIAMSNETMLEHFMNTGELEDTQIREAVRRRELYPCYFGSALKDDGVEELLEGICRYTAEAERNSEFGAIVYKIGRDTSGSRLTYMKITGGSLCVKSIVKGQNTSGEAWEEKADQIRVYSGEKYESISEAVCGTVCAVTGLTMTYAGEMLGFEAARQDDRKPSLEPVMMYRISFPEGTDMQDMLKKLRQLEEEEPQLHIVWNEKLKEIYVKVMGAVQIEILKGVLLSRFGTEAEFDSGNIVYRETIADITEGVGHFEPLRHYAEVHLIMEPLPAGSGLEFRSCCSEDVLDKNWQRLILTHLNEKEHLGVLTGSPVTDMRITLVSGRAHQKHTEGGDFRQATYRAVRQGLRQAKSVLLEPYYSFRLELPSELVGRAMSDIQRMHGSLDAQEQQENDGVWAVLTGSCPVSAMADYPQEVTAYSGGRGKLFCTVSGYGVCHNADEVIESKGYDADGDTDNPTGSIFCAHGAGFYVPWDEVGRYMHIDSALENRLSADTAAAEIKRQRRELQDYYAGEKELQEIFERTYGTSYHHSSIRPENDREDVRNPYKKTTRYGENAAKQKEYVYKGTGEPPEEWLLVDGYNIIFAWDELNELSKASLDAARMSLLEIMCNYQGYKRCNLIVVFDAYKVQGNSGSTEKYKNIYVVYTREAETADQYIERTVHDIGKKHRVTVATSDRLEQMIIMGDGALRLSAAGFREEVDRAENSIRRLISDN